MFNQDLKERLLDQELELVRVKENLNSARAREKSLEATVKHLEKELLNYAECDEEELELERVLRKEVIKAETARVQIDKQKEIAEAYDMKPKAFK